MKKKWENRFKCIMELRMQLRVCHANMYLVPNYGVCM